MSNLPWLTILTLVPLVGGFVVLSLPPARAREARWLALALSLVSLAIALGLWAAFDKTSGGFQFEQVLHDWIPSLAVQYHVGVDGLGLLMVLLTAIVVPMAMLASGGIHEKVPIYFG